MEVDEGFVARRPGNSGLEFWLLGMGFGMGLLHCYIIHHFYSGISISWLE
jgi:hypothetical protein